MTHLPQCEQVPVSDALAEEYPELSHLIDIYILKCVPGCPELERAIELGRQKAKELGW